MSKLKELLLVLSILMCINDINGNIIDSDDMDIRDWDEDGGGSFSVIDDTQYCESGTCYRIRGGGGSGAIQTITETFDVQNYYNIFFTVFTSTRSVDNNEQTAIQYACDNNTFIDRIIDGGEGNQFFNKFINISINYTDITCNDALSTLTIQFRCENCGGNGDFYYIDSLIIYGSTLSPTTTPTKSPSNIPTTTPSLSPTEIPSITPTNMPSNSPSRTPTDTPTNTPTNDPTSSPSNFPTITPTIIPTKSPSNIPSQMPSTTPTFEPSNTPTISPLKASSSNTKSRINSKTFIWLGILLGILCCLTIILAILYIYKVILPKKQPKRAVVNAESKTNTITTDTEMAKADTFTAALETGDLQNPIGLSPRGLYEAAAMDSMRSFEIETNISDDDPIISNLNVTHGNVKTSVV